MPIAVEFKNEVRSQKGRQPKACLLIYGVKRRYCEDELPNATDRADSKPSGLVEVEVVL
jgi:hypothetical protein